MGQVTNISGPIVNAGTAILAAYALFVIPRGVLFDEFSKALTGQIKLDWTGFTWDEPSKYGPNPTERNCNAGRSDHNVLGGIRNAIAHANFTIEFPPDKPDTTVLYMWSQKNETSGAIRHVRVSVGDMALFVMRFHKLFIDWHNNGKAF